MREVYDKLHLCCLTKERHAQTCGYWYTVTNNATSHTAFASKRALYKWMYERGLSVRSPLPSQRGVFFSAPIEGQYIRSSEIYTQDEWGSLPGVFHTGIDLSNGDYVEAKFTIAPDGHTVIEHTLNPNCRWRKTYDYAECDERRHIPTEETHELRPDELIIANAMADAFQGKAKG